MYGASVPGEVTIYAMCVRRRHRGLNKRARRATVIVEVRHIYVSKRQGYLCESALVSASREQSMDGVHRFGSRENRQYSFGIRFRNLKGRQRMRMREKEKKTAAMASVGPLKPSGPEKFQVEEGV